MRTESKFTQAHNAGCVAPTAQVHPDQAVLYEALLAGLGQQKQYYLDEGRADQIYAKLNEIAAGPATTLRLVLDMLFPDQLGKQAASAIEQCVLVSR
jgi:hypothetical protein